MKIQEKSESFYFSPEIPCTRSNYLDVRIFRYSDIYSDIYNIYNIYSPPKFSRTCSTSDYEPLDGTFSSTIYYLLKLWHTSIVRFC